MFVIFMQSVVFAAAVIVYVCVVFGAIFTFIHSVVLVVVNSAGNVSVKL